MEFKLTAVRLTEPPGIQVQTVAHALAIHPFMVSKWRKDAREGRLRGTARKAPPAGPAREIARLQARDDSVARGLTRPAAEATPAQKVAIQSVLGDSLSFTWETRGDTTMVKGTPAFDSAVHRTVTGLGRALLLAEVLYLSIPVTLIGLTASWLAVRRPRQRRARIEPYATEL